MILQKNFQRIFAMKKATKTTDLNQRSIDSFFTKPQTQRLCENIEPPSKRPKIVSSGLSPEHKQRMENNRLRAQNKLQDKALIGADIGLSWKNALAIEFGKPYFQELKKFVSQERQKFTVYPPDKEVFSWTKYFDIKNTKVVIIGQDPYHGPKQAHGLCFSVGVGIKPPPSLVNIYKELLTDIPGFVKPDHGHLIGWASQGVLLLNACLTVVASKPNSHKGKGWEKLTDATIKWIDQNLNGVVFILWGKYAEQKGSFVNKKRHLVLTGRHPSPLSASRGFFGCKHFSKTNEYLKEQKKKEIDWSYLPESIP